MKTSVIAIAALALLTFSSCKKNSSKSKTEFLTQAGWKLVKEEDKTNNGPWIDATGNPPACEKDNITLFRTNNTMEENEGVTKCNSADPQVLYTGTWSFGANEASVIVTVGGSSGTATIEQLDDNTLIITSNEIVGSNTYYYRATYNH